MQNLIKYVLITFLIITFATAILALCGVTYLWLNRDLQDLPYLNVLLGASILEISAVVITFFKKGLKYIPETHTNKNKEETIAFMKQFISSGTSATILSNRASWLTENEDLIKLINDKTHEGIKIEIITNQKLQDEIRNKLPKVDFLTNKYFSTSRFTLINTNRSGCEKLAIAKGIHPEHEITVFDNTNGPQMIGMAKDIIKFAKEKQKCLEDGITQQT
ncbi:Uncharacterised protein [Legionella beliardensis]|uniref:Uncharacterized protein n=1 Tax=Legionella beliardensis TaxID=91822 RepID=A0A378I0E4_9GAMM|nr:hypothetical protein [Legionella beliardensis]STX28463.1 Uncharacterised protein [Legionella beliardensis]